MTQAERMDAYLEKATALLGIAWPDESTEPQAYFRFLMTGTRLLDLVRKHGENQGIEDASTLGPGERAEVMADLAKKAEDLAAALEALPDDIKRRFMFPAMAFRRQVQSGRTVRDKLADMASATSAGPLPPALPELQAGLTDMAAVIRDIYGDGRVGRGRKDQHPDSILIQECISMAKDCGRAPKADGLRLARLAYFTSTGTEPSDEWGVYQVKTARV